MARFTGKQFKGAQRVLKELRREEAEARNKKFQRRKAIAEKMAAGANLPDPDPELTAQRIKAFNELRALEDELELTDTEFPGVKVKRTRARTKKITE